MNILTASSTVFSWQLPSGESRLPICRWMMGSVRDGAVSNRKQASTGSASSLGCASLRSKGPVLSSSISAASKYRSSFS